MKKMSLLIIIMLLVCLTGCGGKKGQVVCTLKSNDVVNGYQLESEYKINYKGDIVESVESVETVTSNSDDILDMFETTLNDTYSSMNKTYGGYNYTVTRDDTTVSSKVTIDYNLMDLKQYTIDQPVLKTYIKNDKLLVEGVSSIYEALGAVCE